MNENQARTSTPNRRGKTTNHDDQTGPEYEKVIQNDNYSVCSDISRVSRRRKNRNDEKSVSIRTPKGNFRDTPQYRPKMTEIASNLSHFGLKWSFIPFWRSDLETLSFLIS